MLVSFSVSNFRSFGEEVTLNMVASNKLPDHPHHRIPIGETGHFVLRSCVAYGANAAGKSNLVRAISVAQDLIRERTERISPVEPFRFQKLTTKTPTSFEFRILVQDRVFIYGFDILVNRFTSEWLAVVDGEIEVEIFTRDEKGISAVQSDAARRFLDDNACKTLNILKSLPLRRDQLLLNRACALPKEAQGKMLARIIDWFTDDLIVLRPNHRTCDIIERLSDNETFRNFCAQFLSNAGTGVGDLEVDKNVRQCEEFEKHYLEFIESQGTRSFPMFGCDSDTDICPSPDDPHLIIVRKLLASHTTPSQKYSLPFCEESDGTQSLLHLMPILSSPPEQSRVFVIDELDRSLHPLICWEFIRFFSNSCIGSRKQLIVTTHEAHLLDQELLRRDEYWFVEKDELQQSKLVSLSEFNVRKDLQVQKGYLAGRFGAIPVIGGMQSLERLLECNNQEEANAAEETPTES